MRLELGEGIRPLVNKVEELDVRANFVAESELARTYLNRGFGNSYDFNQAP